MIIASITYGNGLGALTKGTGFNCSTSICYGVGKENHALLQQLQQLINSFATLARFTPLTVDGFIGAGTVSAGQLAAKVIRGQGLGGDATITQLANGMTKEQIAASAPELITAFTAANNTLAAQGAPVQAVAPITSAPAPVAPTPTAPAPVDSTGITKAFDFVKSFFQPSSSPTPTPPPGGFSPAPTAPAPGAATTPSAAAAPIPPKKTPTWFWVAAGVGSAIVLGGIGYAIFRTPKSAPAPEPRVVAPAPKPALGRGRHRRRRSSKGRR